MLWKDKINEWNNGIVVKYPSNIKNRFYFETSVCNKKLDSKYKEEFIEDIKLNKLEQNFISFDKYIRESKNKYATCFYNLNKDALLIVPIPRKNKNYTTIKDFIDNASITQQKHFWFLVAKNILEMLKNNDKVYISTHGTGVYYLHVRIDLTPKYYSGTLYNR
jgi:hypothetical protein